MVAHEYAHAEAAYRQGDDTAYMLGRLTLNPLKHIDPFMTVVLPALLWIFKAGFLFGAAKPVPVNPRKYRHFVRGDVIVSLAGIGVNLALFTLLDAQFLRPRPVARPEELWRICPSDASGGPRFFHFSRPYYDAIRKYNRAFKDLVALVGVDPAVLVHVPLCLCLSYRHSRLCCLLSRFVELQESNHCWIVLSTLSGADCCKRRDCWWLVICQNRHLGNVISPTDRHLG